MASLKPAIPSLRCKWVIPALSLSTHTITLETPAKRPNLAATAALGFSALISAFVPTVVRAEEPRPAGLPITAATRAEVIRGVIQEVESLYVFPDKARQIAAAIRRSEKSRAFASMDSAGP